MKELKKEMRRRFWNFIVKKFRVAHLFTMIEGVNGEVNFEPF